MPPKEIVTEKHLDQIFACAVDAVQGDNATQRALQSMLKEDATLSARFAGGVFVVAIGKAASAMMSGASKVLGKDLIAGLVITKYGHLDSAQVEDRRITCIESAHPVPDQESLRAGAALVDFVQSLTANDELLILISGGASSLVEALPLGVTLADLQRVNEYLLSTGLDIIQMNVIRQKLSLIKGGRLARHLEKPAGPGVKPGHVRTTQLLISDVPGDKVSSIGSGPLVPPDREPDTISEVSTPLWLTDLLGKGIPAPSVDEVVWTQIQSVIIASNAHARQAACRAARELNLAVQLSDGSLDGPVEEIAQRIATTLAGSSSPGLYVWGGETTVVLPNDPGRGGRNQHLALLLALSLSESSSPAGYWAALCCGTDGSDGPTGDAGGKVSAETINRALQAGCEPNDYLRRADAGSLLAETGDLVTTGPTGTNVCDLVIAWKE